MIFSSSSTTGGVRLRRALERVGGDLVRLRMNLMQLGSRDASETRSGNPKALQPAAVEAADDRLLRDLADLRRLAGGEDLLLGPVAASILPTHDTSPPLIAGLPRLFHSPQSSQLAPLASTPVGADFTARVVRTGARPGAVGAEGPRRTRSGVLGRADVRIVSPGGSRAAWPPAGAGTAGGARADRAPARPACGA